MITLHIGDRLVGSLEQLGGSYSFEYSKDWLQNGFELGPDVPLVQGRQYSAAAFGFIEDASPDRWGRTIILRETRARMKRQKQAPRALTTLDYLLRVSDVSRMGALRAFRDNAFQAAGGAVPPMIQLGQLLRASKKYQAGDYGDEIMQMLLAPGSSLGGARPKASVMDAQGNLYISRFEKAPTLSTAIIPDEFAADLDIAIDHCEYFNLTSPRAALICDEVRIAVATWPDVARRAGATKCEIEAVESAFYTG